MELPPGIAWPEAREALNRFWIERPVELKSWDLVSVGTQLFETPAGQGTEPGEDGWDHLPSTLQGGPLPALSAGARKVFKAGP